MWGQIWVRAAVQAPCGCVNGKQSVSDGCTPQPRGPSRTVVCMLGPDNGVGAPTRRYTHGPSGCTGSAPCSTRSKPSASTSSWQVRGGLSVIACGVMSSLGALHNGCLVHVIDGAAEPHLLALRMLRCLHIRSGVQGPFDWEGPSAICSLTMCCCACSALAGAVPGHNRRPGGAGEPGPAH